MPMIIGRMSIKDDTLYNESNSTSPETEIAGIPTRKESLAAVCLSIPENKAEVKVIPDLETPGNKAKDWAIPNKIISFKSMERCIINIDHPEIISDAVSRWGGLGYAEYLVNMELMRKYITRG